MERRPDAGPGSDPRVPKYGKPGEVIGGRYRLIKSLGRGGMGEVFAAKDEQGDREIALKRFRLDLDSSEDLLRFRREFHTLARLRHPRVVEAYDFGVDDGRPFYTMELLDGQDFGDLAPLPWQRACGLLRDVASALAFLHTRALLHRDIAPRNARCTTDGRAKLLDFGMLATMGSTTEIVGTVHSIAPEMILGFPMDGRADLFGLGALAFWLLTGRHPRRARNLNDLIREGRSRPPAPSTVVAEIPAELDELVLSLLSHEPLGRPSSAAHVIERLGAIAGLPPAEELEVARGYVRSAELVGRRHELEVVRKRLMRAMSGSGSTIVVEGRSGMGKTRLLHEIELEAKLAGARVLRAGPQSGGPYALLRQLGIDGRAAAFESIPGPEDSVIGRLLGDDIIDPNAATFVGTVVSPSGPKSSDLREERLALQTALAERLAALAERRPLVVVIDDLQRADEGSAATLAALAFEARDKRILIVCALRTDEPIGARRAVAKIREHAIVLHPGGLGSAEIEQLLRTMFGASANLSRLATWLRRQAGGSPLHVIEIVRHLVERGVIHSGDGVWAIPERFADEGLPRGLAEAMDARIRGLSEHAHALGRAVAVHGGRKIPLHIMVALAAPLVEDEVFAALAELEREDILTGSGERWSMRHEGLREAFLRELDPIERARLELHVGRTLLADGAPTAEREAAIGWHLLRGGERRLGARLLARSGKRLYEATSFADAIAPLSAALEVYEETGTNPSTRVRLLEMLHTAGFFSDRDTAIKYRDETVRLLGRYAGIPIAMRLRFLGVLAIVVGIAIRGLIRSVYPPGRRAPSPISAMRMWLRAVVYSAGVAGFSFDTDQLRRSLRWLAPVAKSKRPDIANAVRFVENLLAFNLGRINTVRETGTEELAQFLENAAGDYSIAERRLIMGGVVFQRGLAAVRSGTPDALSEIAALERLDTRLWNNGALQLRSHYHMWRGEDDEARRVWAEAELEFVRLGSQWQLEAVHHASACVTAGYAGDTLGLKRHIEALARQVAAGLKYRAHLDVARGEHARLRGDFEAALKAIDGGLAQLPPDEGLIRPWALTARADVLIGLGDIEAARKAAEDALTICSDFEHGQASFRLRAIRAVALCESALGEHDIAAARIDDAIEKTDALVNPLLLGCLHETRAQIAIAAGNEVAAATAIAQVEFWFRPTRNPVLIARWERLERALHPAPDPDLEPSANDIVTEMFGNETVHHDTLAEVLSILSDCRTANARAERALEMLVEASGAKAGLLYLAHRGRLALAAPTHGAEPPAELTRAAVARFAKARESPDTVALGFEPIDEAPSSGWCSSIIACVREGHTRLVGALLLRGGERGLELPSESLGEAIAQRLSDDLEAGAPSVSVSER